MRNYRRLFVVSSAKRLQWLLASVATIALFGLCAVGWFAPGIYAAEVNVAAGASCSLTSCTNVRVIASTSWVAAIAEAAGVEDVTVLAPLDLRHPPEYDFRPSDVQAALQADYIIYAGYEGFIGKLRQSAGLPDSCFLQTVTSHIPANLQQETRKLAAVFGTQQQQQAWEKEYGAVVATVQDRAAQAGIKGKRVVAHAFLAEYAAWLGLQVVGTFGGGEELTPVKMAGLTALKPDLIVDNWHNEQGAGIAQAAKAPRAVLINFPGHAGTRTLIDVLLYNARQLGI